MWGSQETSTLCLHGIGPAARFAPSGGMAPLLVLLYYNVTSPTLTCRLQVLSLIRTSASRSGTTRASVAGRTGAYCRAFTGGDRLLSRNTVPPSCEGARTHQTCGVLGDTGGWLRVRPIKTSRPLNVLHSTTSCGVAAGRQNLSNQPPKYLY